MANTKTLRGNVSLWAAYPEGVTFDAPTTTEMADTDYVKDISCAVEDSYTANLTSSDTDDSLSICDVSQVSTPTLKNYEVSLDGFRDADPAATGVYNLFFDLFKAKGVPFYIIKRVGAPQGDPVAVGDILNLYYVKTDNPQNIINRGEPVRLGARFKPQGEVNPEYEVVA